MMTTVWPPTERTVLSWRGTPPSCLSATNRDSTRSLREQSGSGSGGCSAIVTSAPYSGRYDTAVHVATTILDVGWNESTPLQDNEIHPSWGSSRANGDLEKE